MENVTLIVDATPIPILHRRNDAKQGDEGVWDGAHHMWGTIFHHCLSSKCVFIIIKLHNF
jgi:hypothetical protein